MKELLDTYKRGKEKFGNGVCLIIRGEQDLYYLFENDAKAAQEIAGTLLFLVTEEHVMASYFKYSELDFVLPKLVRAGKRVAII